MSEIDREEITEDFFKERYIPDGIYDITDIPYVDYPDDRLNVILKKDENIKKFIEEHKDTVVMGRAYEVPHTFFLAKAPEKVNIFEAGDGFNYGAAAVLTNAPQKILILAEND